MSKCRLSNFDLIMLYPMVPDRFLCWDENQWRGGSCLLWGEGSGGTTGVQTVHRTGTPWADGAHPSPKLLTDCTGRHNTNNYRQTASLLMVLLIIFS